MDVFTLYFSSSGKFTQRVSMLPGHPSSSWFWAGLIQRNHWNAIQTKHIVHNPSKPTGKNTIFTATVSVLEKERKTEGQKGLVTKPGNVQSVASLNSKCETRA